MSSALVRPSSTVPSPTSDKSSPSHSCPPLEDGVVARETGAGDRSLVDSTVGTQMDPTSPDAMSSPAEAGTASSTTSFDTSEQNAAGHSHDLVENGVTVGERGTSEGSFVNLTTLTSTRPISPAMAQSPEREPCATSFHISEQSATGHSFDRVEDDTRNAVGETGAGKKYWPRWMIRPQMLPTSPDAMSSSPGRTSSTSHVSDLSAAGHDNHGVEEASRCTDTCNVVIFGETGAGKSSLVNLITRTQTALTSPDADGCTTKTNVYAHDVVTQNTNVKVQLFDTPGLDEASQGMVPTTQTQIALKNLLRTLKKKRGIHLVMYCVQGSKDAWTLQRNYKLLRSKVKGGVPIVLVVTGLEDRKPEMEEWWKNNEKAISDFGMTFAGHACITAVTVNDGDTDDVRQRSEQSYRAVWNLIEQCCPQNRTGVPKVVTLPPEKKTKNIVLFGEAGVGKSSVVNLMAGREVAVTSLSMRRCTLHWQDYTINFDGESYKVFDTIGIEDSGLEMKEYLAAVANAYRFIRALDAEGGVDLLLFCIRAGRFTAALQNNYRFFYEFLCKKKVPVVLVITNLEREQRMEDWWEREHAIFPRYQIHVAGHACITAANGLDGRHQHLYEESRIAIRKLVKENIAGQRNQEWTGGNKLFRSLVRALKKLLVKNSHIRKMNLTGQLTKSCGVSRETAVQLADMIEQGEVKEIA